MRKRSLSAVARCLSVRLSVALVYYIQTVEDIVKLLSRPGSTHHSSFFLTPSAGTPFSLELDTGAGDQKPE